MTITYQHLSVNKIHKITPSKVYHGDYLGACSPNYRADEETSGDLTWDNESGSVTIFPNPFSPDQSGSATISFFIPQSEQVSFRIFDMNGRLIKTLADRIIFEEGKYQIEFDAERLNAGIYYLKVERANFSEIQKLSVIK